MKTTNEELCKSVLKIIGNKSTPCRIAGLARELSMGRRHRRFLRNCLKSLVTAGKIIALKGGRYTCPRNSVSKEEKSGRKTIVGFLRKSGTGFRLLPIDRNIGNDFRVARSKLNGAAHDDAVLAEVEQSDDPDTMPKVTVTKILGQRGETSTTVKMILSDRGIQPEFPFDPPCLPEPDGTCPPGRIDLRSLTTITIDGPGARDFDDALSAKTAGNGGWRLWVHIADVGSYVHQDDPIDVEARRRGTTIYYPGGCVPMLPPELSENLCSLLPHRDRFALTCEMLINRDGTIARSRFFPSLIHCDERLTYGQVEEYLDYSAGVRREIRSLLELCRDITSARKQQRRNRGGLDCFFPEARVLFDSNERVVDVVKQEALFSFQLVEECMLAANECAARHAQRHKLPVLYRRHTKPDADKVAELAAFFRLVGIDTSDLDLSRAASWPALLDRLGRNNVFVPQLLRSQNRAVYSEKPSGHFGLALHRYCHFTSPIRRYPDLWTHRVLKAHIQGSTINTDKSRLNTLALHCSETEQAAEAIDREIHRRLAVEYMEQWKGCRFRGTVTSVHPFGVFVQIDNPYVDGMIRVSDLGTEYYRFNSKRRCLVGDSSGRGFSIGDAIDVVLKDVDTVSGFLNLLPAHVTA